MLKYYTYNRETIDDEIIDFISGEQEAEVFSFGDSKTFLVAIDGEAPVQNQHLFYEELSFEQFAAQVNDSDQKKRNKDRARVRIEKEVGDDKDLLADISKRLALTERLLMRLTGELLPTLAKDSYVKAAYGGMITQYLAGVDSGIIKDRVDFENTADVFNTLTQRTIKIGKIVDEEYLSKKVQRS